MVIDFWNIISLICIASLKITPLAYLEQTLKISWATTLILRIQHRISENVFDNLFSNFKAV